eukprot:CAMPEP_0119138840 /NCGR_PEP_ID=MMETSP1310-20130426/26417_1 /TAXON_ID=464262 /ORGANISM="Genus nov. species nov., Strain RCC2339" /LENGTH=328 /DNA_ID=CAMNT_0007130071 /DNA_START=16 /DNA_END=999 /DNA_ORIENTATION=-
MDIKNDGSFLSQFLNSQGGSSAQGQSAASPYGPPPGTQPEGSGAAATTSAGGGAHQHNAAYAQQMGYMNAMYPQMMMPYGGQPGAWGHQAGVAQQQSMPQQRTQPIHPMAPPPAYPAQPGPPMQQPVAPTKSIWVGNLPHNVSEADLRMLYGDYGPIDNIKILHQKNCAFLDYGTLEGSANCYRQSRGKTLRGFELKVGWGKSSMEGRAINRAPLPPPDEVEPSTNLWLGGVTHETSEEELYQMFSRFGHVDRVKIVADKGCAFINFEQLDCARRAREEMQGFNLKGRSVRINFGKDNGPPERFRDRDRFHDRGPPFRDRGPPPFRDV